MQEEDMQDNDLKRLNRAQLLQMLLEQSVELEQTKRQLQLAQAQLHQRQIDIDRAGSIAEAALALSGVFEAAQDAVDQYLENLRRMPADKLLAQHQRNG